jgi:hypothetical protein
MLNTGSKVSEVALLLSKKCDKIVLSKDLHNLNDSSKIKESEALGLENAIKKQIKRDNDKNYFNFIQSEDGIEFNGLFYQNKRMRSLFQTYGTIMFIDGTYKVNRKNFPVIIFVVTDNNRQSRIVGVAIVACERLVILDVVLEHFKKLNNTTSLKYVMIDKDLKEESAILKSFPMAQIVYCFWHNEKTFRKMFSNETFNCAKEMMLALTEEKFNEKLKEFNELEKNNSKNLEYLKDNWLNCIEKWARFKRVGIPLNLQETNNPVEVVNHQVKEFSENQHAKSSLGSCLDSIFLYIKTSELKKIILANVQKNKLISIQNVSTDSIINDFYKIVAPNMAAWMRDQYEKATTIPYNFESANTEGFSLVKINEKVYTIRDLQLDTASCSCYEYQSLNIPCRHLFFARSNQNVPLFNNNMIHDRHKLNLIRKDVEDTHLNLLSSVPNLENIRSFVTSKNMTQKSKWEAAWRLSQEFANCLKYKKQQDFEVSLSKLMTVKQLLQTNTDFDIVTKEVTTNSSEIVMPSTSSAPTDIEINSSQSSTISTPSKDFNFSVSSKRIPDGTCPGRKADKRSKIDHSEGQLSLYSSGNILAVPITVSSKPKSLLHSTTSNFKNVFEQRMFGLLENILIDKRKAHDVLSGAQIVEEEHLIVDVLLSKKSYYEYNQFLKTSSNFSAFFSADGLKQLEASLMAFKLKNFSEICSKIFIQKDIVKTCSICYTMHHFSCSSLAKNSSKKWTCTKCS